MNPMNVMMISCKKAADLTCASLDRPLTLWETVRLRFHLLMCDACKAFQLQNEALLRLFELRFRDPAYAKEESRFPQLPPNACERLKEKLREAARSQNPPQ